MKENLVEVVISLNESTAKLQLSQGGIDLLEIAAANGCDVSQAFGDPRFAVCVRLEEKDFLHLRSSLEERGFLVEKPVEMSFTSSSSAT